MPDEVFRAVRELQHAEGLPSLSRAVGVALTEWYAVRRRDGVQNPADGEEEQG